jgi:hypothetical protein
MHCKNFCSALFKKKSELVLYKKDELNETLYNKHNFVENNSIENNSIEDKCCALFVPFFQFFRVITPTGKKNETNFL